MDNHKLIKIKIVSIIFIFGLIACKADESNLKRPSANVKWVNLATAAQPFQNKIIKILGENLPPLQSLERLRPRFEKETNIHLNINMKDHSTAVRSILSGALTKEYQYDLIFIPHKEIGRLVQTHSIRRLDEFYNNPGLRDPLFDPKTQLFEPFFSEVGTYEGNWYGLPLYLGGSIVVYRKDLTSNKVEQEAFRKRFGTELVVPPRNHEEWLRLAQHFYRPNSNPPLYGIALLLSDESLWYEWQSALFSFGGTVLDTQHGWEIGPVVVNSPEAIRATEFYKTLSEYGPPDAVKYSWPLGIAKMQAGVNFMTLLQYDVVAEFEDPKRTNLAGKFGYFLPPGPQRGCTSQLESWVGFIPTSAKAPEAAWLLLQWMMNAEIQLTLHLEGNISPRRSTYDDPRVISSPPTAVILNSLECMTPKPTIPQADGIQQIITEALQSYFAGQTSAKKALDQAAMRIHERLGDRAPLRFPIK